MIYLIVRRIRLAEMAAHFLKLPNGTWRFVVMVENLQAKSPEPGDIFINVYEPRTDQISDDDREKRDAVRLFLKHNHIQTVNYTLP